MEIAFAGEANVALYGSITNLWAWFSEGVTTNRILDREFFTENITHQEDGRTEKEAEAL